nr:MFS transporter [Candidatus Njordarchaeota archaeon]
MKRSSLSSRSAYVAIVLLGIVSLMGDVVYEGARGLVPDYLFFLGATALIVGLVSGLGEFLGYIIRLGSGALADRTRAYWFFMFLGYGLILSIPLLGFAWSWEIAIIFILLERLGKGFRAPARDTVLSIVSKDVGPGKAFGIHELLDQVGAVLGPLIVAMLMFYTLNNYQETFGFLILPFLILIIVLIVTRKKIGARTYVKEKAAPGKGNELGRSFYVYTFAVTLNTLGLIPVALILFKASALLEPINQKWLVPLIYMLVQGVDAAIAPIAGLAFDKYGINVLVLPFVVSVFPTLFTIVGTGLEYLISASIFFGFVLGMQESIYRAAVSRFAPIQVRGTAYGIFNAAFGTAFLVGGGIFGLLFDISAPFMLILLFVVSTQALATVALLGARRASKTENKRR